MRRKRRVEVVPDVPAHVWATLRRPEPQPPRHEHDLRPLPAPRGDADLVDGKPQESSVERDVGDDGRCRVCWESLPQLYSGPLPRSAWPGMFALRHRWWREDYDRALKVLSAAVDGRVLPFLGLRVVHRRHGDDGHPDCPCTDSSAWALYR